jgi:hypothetical protein
MKYGIIACLLIAAGAMSWGICASVRQLKLPTMAAYFGLLVKGLAAAVASFLWVIGVAIFRSANTVDMTVWIIVGGLWIAALAIWYLGHRVYGVLARSPLEQPQPTRAAPHA